MEAPLTEALPEHLVRDYHPVELYDTRTDQVLSECRVFITSQRILVWAERIGGMVETSPRLVLEDVPTEALRPDRGTMPRAGLHLTVPGGVLHLNPGKGCGCHSILKALGPPVPW